MRTEEKGMNCRQEDDSNGCTSSDGDVIRWSSDTNWAISYGSLESTINIESSDTPITESDQQNSTPNPPMVLTPQSSDSGPCEIKISFNKKYDLGQIYVRSSARVYEIYYGELPQSSSEYLCTVRCGVAERDENLLRTDSVEDGSSERGGSSTSTGETMEGSVTDGENVTSSDDEWVKIKASELSRSSTPNKSNINRMASTQDLYEATAQLSDVEPCSTVTIRLLSLQDKSHVYVDEIYFFVDHVEPTDSVTEVQAGNSTRNPLMAMLLPTLMQLSMQGGVGRVKDKRSSEELQKDSNEEPMSRRTDDVESEKSKVHLENVNLKENCKDTVESDAIMQPLPSLKSEKCVEFTDVSDLQPGRLESTMEQLVSRVNRLEDIFLRFEEKVLKPIERMELRLERVENQLDTRFQHVEYQLEKLSKNFEHAGLPRGTRISAPTFSCSESNSSSFFSEGRDCTPSEVLEVEKKGHVSDSLYENIRPGLVVRAPDFSCTDSNSSSFHQEGNDNTNREASEVEKKNFPHHNMSDNSQYENNRPGLVVSAPEFSCGDDREEKDGLKVSKNSFTSKKTLSLEDALSAALHKFMSTAQVNDSEYIEPDSRLSTQADEKNQLSEVAESCEMKTQALSGFVSTSIVNESELIQPTSGFSCEANEMNPENSSILSIKAPDFTEEGISVEELVNTGLDHGDDSDPPSIDTKTSPISTDFCDLNTYENFKDGFASESSSAYSSSVTRVFDAYLDVIGLHTSESSHASSLDFEFPILDVKFTSDACTTTKSLLESLLEGDADPNMNSPVYDTFEDDGNTSVQQNDGDMNATLPNDYLLVDIGVSDANESSKLDGEFNNISSSSSSEITVSLI